MQILSVTLKNFKTHRDRHFSFQPGTNAICGENGAGKTSILEAIAWVMFNHRGAYKVEDLIRNGAGSAQAIVMFVSDRDGRTYEIQRCTTKGYTVYDPQLDVKLDYRSIEAEILPWIRQQLGVAPGTDLARLFANTIGVPQGTFTVDFLQPPKDRKAVFDSILKVEEYQQVQKDSRQLEKYAEDQVAKLADEIVRHETDLAEWDSLTDRQQTVITEIVQSEAALQQLEGDLAKLQAVKEQFAAQAEQVQQTAQQVQQLTTQLDSKQQAIGLLRQAVQQAEQAVELCTANRASHDAYLKADQTLKQLDQHLKQKQILLRQKEQQQQALLDRHKELTRLQIQLESLEKAETEIQQLQPAIAQQAQLEQAQIALTNQLNHLQINKTEHKNGTKQLQKLQGEAVRLQQEIDRIQTVAAQIKHIPDLEQKRDRLQEQLSRVEAAKQFEAELRQLVSEGEAKRDRHQLQSDEAIRILREVQRSVPLLATVSVKSALEAVQAGVDLNTDLLQALWRILADLSEQVSVSKLQQQLQQIKTQLQGFYQFQAEVAALEAKQEQQSQIQQELSQLHSRLDQLKDEIETEPDRLKQREQLSDLLKSLNSPRERAQLLQQQIEKQEEFKTQYVKLYHEYQQIQQQIQELDRQLAPFAAIEDQIEQQKSLQRNHQNGYLTVLQQQQTAERLPQLQSELIQTIAHLQQLESSRSRVQAEYDRLLQHYDPQQGQQIEMQYTTLRSQADRISGALPQQRKLLAELEHQLSNLKAIAEQRDRAQLALKEKQKVLKFITTARKIYKQAAPRITERYVQSISKEADRLFRELLNRQNVALEWTNEYEIIVQEGAHTRRFVNLSGGEQMCAALAVRLALLRVLADIDVAFFDEPTTNMDKPRRESLAEAIAGIKSFRQLFVISHDDTFEKVTENVIFVEREA
ncbi:SMC family ATPase [Leptolyngbya sp. FACHB-711]|nr:SMC family ATPase [Leptolyngbya sp. FACHB-711]